MFVFLKIYMKRTPTKIVICWCLEPNLEQDSICIYMKSVKISSKSDTCPSISQSGVAFQQIKKKFLEHLGLTVLPSQKNSQFTLAFSLFYEYNAAWTGFLTKYSECECK